MNAQAGWNCLGEGVKGHYSIGKAPLWVKDPKAPSLSVRCAPLNCQKADPLSTERTKGL